MKETLEKLNYYKDILKTDFYLSFFFKENYFLQNKDDKSKEQFVFFGNSNNEARETFNEILINLYNDKSKSNKSVDINSLYSFYYSPFLIEYNYLEKNDIPNTLYISPFFIELEIEDGNNPLKIIDVINSSKKEDFEKDIFGYKKNNPSKEIILNSAMLIEPFELLASEFYEKINLKRKDKSKDLVINSMKDLFEFIGDYLNVLNNSNNIKIDSLDEAKTIFEKCLKRNLEKLNLRKNFNIRKDSFYFMKNNTLGQVDESIINGLLKIYDEINKNKLNENNLLNFILKGNDYKYKRNEESSFLDITPRKNALLIGEHYGALSSEFDLTTSQKYCLNLTNSTLPVIPVNGAAGTGKTSLLRAMVGDITVKNALLYLKECREYKDEFSFKTPIVSFSTNNRALDNIIEGIVSAYDDIEESLKKEEKLLAKRWINPNIEFNYYNNERVQTTISGNINDIRLYIPKIKNTSEYIVTNPKYPIFGASIGNLSGIITVVNKNLNYHIIEFLKNMNSIFGCFEDDFKEYESNENYFDNKKKTLLKKAIFFLGNKIEENNEILKEKNKELISWIDSKTEIIDLCKDFISKYNSFRDEDYPILIIIEKKEFNYFEKQISCELELIEKRLDEYKKQIAINDKLKDEKIRETHNEFLSILIELEKKYNEEIDNINHSLTLEEKILSKKLKKQIAKKNEFKVGQLNKLNTFYNSLNFFKRIYFKLFKYNTEITNIETLIKKSIIKLKNLNKKKLANLELDIKTRKEIVQKKFSEFKTHEEGLNSEKISKINNDFIQLNLNTLNKFKETNYIFIYDDIEELENIINILKIDFYKIVNIKNKFFYEDYEEIINKIYDQVDKKIRTKSFLYATHLQEAALLTELHQQKINSESPIDNDLKCPNCGNNSVYHNKNNSNKTYFKCKCSFIYVENVIPALSRIPNNFEKNNLFKNGFFTHNGDTFNFKKHENGFWNIEKNKSSNTKESKIFNYLSVFFPIVNTTCHSFGLTMPLKEQGIDYLFIDEGGMVLSPYIVNLYTGKKVFIFGDEKQIEPIYPLNALSGYKKIFKKEQLVINEDNEENNAQGKQEEINNYLLRKHISNKDVLSEINFFQGVLNSSVMSLANNSIFVQNKYQKKFKDENGDIWLREHFRCSKDIIEFCNIHFYNNTIKMLKPNKKDKNHLFILNHDYNQRVHPNGSKYNEEEAVLIIEDIKNRIIGMSELEKNDYLKTIGIISPYKEQANCISKIARIHKLENLISGTVHKFQGSERDIIYLSTTIGINDDCSNAFFNKKEKPNIINVAITRAKNEFILVGNKNSLLKNKNSLTASLIQHIESKYI